MRLHTDDGPFQSDGEPIQTELSKTITAFFNDSGHRTLIVTGTGGTFSSPRSAHRLGGPRFWERSGARTFGWILGLLDFLDL